MAKEIKLQEHMIALEKAEAGRARAEEALVAAEEKLHKFLHNDTKKLWKNKRLRKYYLKKDKVVLFWTISFYSDLNRRP